MLVHFSCFNSFTVCLRCHATHFVFYNKFYTPLICGFRTFFSDYRNFQTRFVFYADIEQPSYFIVRSLCGAVSR